jgi:hypothetical protein
MMQNHEEGFIRLQTDAFMINFLANISNVILQKQRIVLAQGEEEVAAIIPAHEFERLQWTRYDIKYGQFMIDEEYNYEDDSGTPCINIKELEWNFEQILQRVMCNDETFGLIFATDSFSDNIDNFIPGAILMNIHKFWIPDYWLIK